MNSILRITSNILIFVLTVVYLIVIRKKQREGQKASLGFIFLGAILAVNISMVGVNLLGRADIISNDAFLVLLDVVKWVFIQILYILALTMGYKATHEKGFVRAWLDAGIVVHLVACALLSVGTLLSLVNARIYMSAYHSIMNMSSGGATGVDLFSMMGQSRKLTMNSNAITLISLVVPIMFGIRYLVLSGKGNEIEIRVE